MDLPGRCFYGNGTPVYRNRVAVLWNGSSVYKKKARRFTESAVSPLLPLQFAFCKGDRAQKSRVVAQFCNLHLDRGTERSAVDAGVHTRLQGTSQIFALRRNAAAQKHCFGI